MRKKHEELLRKETQLVVSHLSDVVHLSPRGAPWIVRGGSTDLCLSIRVTFGVVFGDTEGSLAKMLHDCVASKSPAAAQCGKAVTQNPSQGQPITYISHYISFKKRHADTLMVKRLSCLPSKQAAGVRLPFSVFICPSHTRGSHRKILRPWLPSLRSTLFFPSRASEKNRKVPPDLNGGPRDNQPPLNAAHLPFLTACISPLLIL